MLDNVVLPEGYKLFWAEEFDGHEINSSYWNAGSFASGAGDSVPEDHCGRSCLEVGESCLTISPSYFCARRIHMPAYLLIWTQSANLISDTVLSWQESKFREDRDL